MQTWGLLQVLLNLVDLNLQVFQRLLNFFSKFKRRIYFSADNMVEISKATALFFWGYILKLKKEFTKWVPHLLNEKQKGVPVTTARKLLKRFLRYD